jgi:DNA-binding beta-propeller fold protein YncE
MLLVVTATALAMTGDLTEPAGTAGCVSDDGSGPCANGHALVSPQSVAVSPDGKNVYVASGGQAVGDRSALVRFNRNRTTGAISQPAGAAGCVSEDGSGPCADGHGLAFAMSVAVSPDGKNVYVASEGGGVARFNRNSTTGAITQPAGSAGCVSDDGSGPCADGHGLLFGAWSVAVSPDGKSVYAASQGGTVVRFNRNTTTGAITEPAGAAGCMSEPQMAGCTVGHGLRGPFSVAVSPDSKSVYVASAGSDAVARLDRNTTTGAISQPVGAAGCISDTGAGPCADGHGLDGPVSVAASQDGKSVFFVSNGDDAVGRLDRNTTTGAISQPPGFPGCISESGAGGCRDGHGLDGPVGVAASPDGKSVYVASQTGSAVARLIRTTTRGIAQPGGITGCVSETGAGTCADGHGLDQPLSVAVSPANRSVYVASIRAVVRFNRAP